MKRLLRKIVAYIVGLTAKFACKTYGDVSQLSAGPCKRCVGMEVRVPGHAYIEAKAEYPRP